MIDPESIEVWACLETARARASDMRLPFQTLGVLDTLPIGVHVLVCDNNVPDIADAAREWSLMFPMTFLVWLRGSDADEHVPPEIDFTVHAHDLGRAALLALVMDWLYADARFAVPIDVSGRTFCMLTNNFGMFGSTADFLSKKLTDAGAVRVERATTDDVLSHRVMEVYIGPVEQMKACGCLGTGLLWMCAVEQPQGYRGEYVLHADVYGRAEHILACSHVIARHVRGIIDAAKTSISLTPAMLSTFHLAPVVTKINEARKGALQFGNNQDRRVFVQNVSEASRTHEPSQITLNSQLWGTAKHTQLHATLVVFIPNSNERPTFTPMHRVAEVWACGPLILAEATDDTVSEALLQKLGHLVCAYGQMPRVVQAALSAKTHSMPYAHAHAVVEAALQTRLGENWLTPTMHAAQTLPAQTVLQPVRREPRAAPATKQPPKQVEPVNADVTAASDWRTATIVLGCAIGALAIAFLAAGLYYTQNSKRKAKNPVVQA